MATRPDTVARELGELLGAGNEAFFGGERVRLVTRDAAAPAAKVGVRALARFVGDLIDKGPVLRRETVAAVRGSGGVDVAGVEAASAGRVPARARGRHPPDLALVGSLLQATRFAPIAPALSAAAARVADDAARAARRWAR